MAKKRNPKGLGHYYKKGDLFCWKYTRDGKTIYRSSKTEKGLQIKVSKVLGTRASNDKTTVKEYFMAWLENDIKDIYDLATYKQYASITYNHILPVIGDYRMSSIVRDDIQRVIKVMNKKGLSEKTMKHAKSIMNIVFTKALDDDKIISENPVYKITIPSKQEKVQKTLNTEELTKFFKAISTSRWKWSVWFDLVTGLRRWELTALRSSDIDWNNRRILVNKSNSKEGLGGTKNRKTHYIALTNMAMYFLDKQFEMLKAEKNPAILNDDGTIKSGFNGEDFLIFPTEKGTMVKPDTYYHTIVRYANKAGVKAHPHAFRHTFTYFLRNKLSLKELQEALSHEESTTTLDIYGNILNDINEETMQKMDSVFSKLEQEIIKELNISNKKATVINIADLRKAK